MKHFSCFTGIGGIDLAAEWAGFETVGQVELADYPHSKLCKHWPDVPKWRDIRDVTGRLIRELCNGSSPTLLSGGFPCQPFSYAGNRKGDEDDRFLWPEMLRVVSECRPSWFIGENVPGIITLALDQAITDLESIGYSVRTFDVPACAVGAHHIRRRIFIVANSNKIRCDMWGLEGEGIQRKNQTCNEVDPGSEKLADTNGSGCLHGQIEELTTKAREYAQCQSITSSPYVPNSYSEGLEGTQDSREIGREGTETIEQFAGHYPGPDNWTAEPGVCGVADGVSNRVDRIKCLGNAVVPEQIFPIINYIAQIENMA